MSEMPPPPPGLPSGIFGDPPSRPEQISEGVFGELQEALDAFVGEENVDREGITRAYYEQDNPYLAEVAFNSPPGFDTIGTEYQSNVITTGEILDHENDMYVPSFNPSVQPQPLFAMMHRLPNDTHVVGILAGSDIYTDRASGSEDAIDILVYLLTSPSEGTHYVRNIYIRTPSDNSMIQNQQRLYAEAHGIVIDESTERGPAPKSTFMTEDQARTLTTTLQDRIRHREN